MNPTIAFMLAWKLISLFLVAPPEHTLAAGNRLYRQGQYQSAETLYRKVFHDSRQGGRAYYNAGNAAFRRADFAGAAAYYEKAVEIDPQDEDAWHNLEMARRRLPPGPEESAPAGLNPRSTPPSPREQPDSANQLLEESREKEKQSLRIRQPKRSEATRGMKRDFFNLPPEELMQMMRQRMETNYMFQPTKPSHTLEEEVPDEVDW